MFVKQPLASPESAKYNDRIWKAFFNGRLYLGASVNSCKLSKQHNNKNHVTTIKAKT